MSSNGTKTWEFDFRDESDCLHHIRCEAEELSNSTVQQAVLAKLDTGPDLYDLASWVEDQLSSPQFEAADEETQSAWGEIEDLIARHTPCDCTTVAWVSYGRESWIDWLQEQLPEDASHWVYVKSDETYLYDSVLGPDFSTKKLCESLDNKEGWVSLSATYDPTKRSFRVKMDTGSGHIEGDYYAPTSADDTLVDDLNLYDAEGVYAYLWEGGSKRPLQLIAALDPLFVSADSVYTFRDAETSDYFNEGLFAVETLLSNLPEESHAKLYELAPTWEEDVLGLCIEAAASTLSEYERPAFLTLTANTTYGDDLKPLVTTAKTIMMV